MSIQLVVFCEAARIYLLILTSVHTTCSQISSQLWCNAVGLLLLFRFPPMSPSSTLCVCCREQTWWRWVWLAQQCKKYFQDGFIALTRRRDRKRFNRSCWTRYSAWGVFLSWSGFKKVSSIYAETSWMRRRKFFSQAKVMSFLGLWCNSNLILYLCMQLIFKFKFVCIMNLCVFLRMHLSNLI